MPRGLQPDKQLIGVTLALCFIGAVMVFSASAMTAQDKFGAGYIFLLRQFVYIVLGIAGMFAMMNTDYRKLRQPRVVFTGLTLTFVLLVAVYFLDRSHATHRWFRAGPFSFQPSEMAKLALIVFLAWFLESRRSQGKLGANDPWGTLAPALGTVLMMAALVVKEPDMGTAFMIVLIGMVMLYVAGLSYKYIGGALLAAIPTIYLLIVRVPYRLARFEAFLHPDRDPQGAGFQLLQSLIAVGSGGMTGVGLMESRQKLFFLPEAHTDFIYAIISEEFGFIGAVVVLTLFAIYGWRGFVTAMKAPDEFGKYLAMGITTMIVGQALINLSVVIGLMPTKGIPLPFISYGGSSLFGALVATGVLLNISQHADEAWARFPGAGRSEGMVAAGAARSAKRGDRGNRARNGSEAGAAGRATARNNSRGGAQRHGRREAAKKYRDAACQSVGLGTGHATPYIQRRVRSRRLCSGPHDSGGAHAWNSSGYFRTERRARIHKPCARGDLDARGLRI